MAQVYVPDNPVEREQLQGGSSSPESKQHPRRRSHIPRRFGGIDLLVLFTLLAAITFIVIAASRWIAPLTPAVSIDLSLTALPLYAGYSLLRMLLGYLLSLVFTLVYGHIAATNRHASIVMVPLLDILQSIPILSFLPAVVLALVAAFPHSNIGLELAACAGNSAATATATATPHSTTNTSSPPSTSLKLSGLLKNSGILALSDLQAFPKVTVSVAVKPIGAHMFGGALLYAVLQKAEVTTLTGRKNDLLRKSIVVSGTDGYTVALSWGEIDPQFANKQVLLAYEEDG